MFDSDRHFLGHGSPCIILHKLPCATIGCDRDLLSLWQTGRDQTIPYLSLRGVIKNILYGGCWCPVESRTRVAAVKEAIYRNSETRGMDSTVR